MRDLPFNLIFLASAEEEISGKNGIELAMKELPKIDLAIVGEPTNMKMAIAEKEFNGARLRCLRKSRTRSAKRR